MKIKWTDKDIKLAIELGSRTNSTQEDAFEWFKNEKLRKLHNLKVIV